MDQDTRPDLFDASGIRIQDAFRDDPTIPRVIEYKDAHYKGYREKWQLFPDGSATVTTVHPDGSEVVDTPGKQGTPAKPEASPGIDEALRHLAETRAGTLVHDGAGWWAFDGALWRRRPDIAREVRAALREAGTADPWPALVAAVEHLARQDPSLTSSPAFAPADAWDRDPMLLGTPGGTVDLATGILRPADPADRITRATSVAPTATADCPLWRRFLAEAMEGDADRVRFLQRFCGYALTGETSEHVLLFGLGEGGNGKSVFANTLRTILGSYAAVAAPDLLSGGAGHRARQLHSAEVAMLAGARLVTASETEENRTWADGRLKLLTGGDPVTARFPGRDPFTFTPRFKLLVTGNHMPALRCVDAALRRRLRLVPFAHRPAAPDRRLEARLRAEAPAILRWMIEGCVAWAAEGPDGGLSGGFSGGSVEGLAGAPADGLACPAAVATATDGYLAGEDLVGQFLAEWCDRAPSSLESSADLYAAWCAFARTLGEPPGTQRRLATRLARHGLEREHRHHARVYRGVRLLREGERFAAVRAARMGG